MQIEDTALPGIKILTPKRFDDHRGFFSKSWNKTRMEEAGLHYDFVQDNHSLSSTVGTVRGLHFQSPPHAPAKLVRCARGRLFGVAVFIRKVSLTYGKWVGFELSFENGKQLMIPASFLHGFITREPDTEITYKCTTTMRRIATALCASMTRRSASTRGWETWLHCSAIRMR